MILAKKSLYFFFFLVIFLFLPNCINQKPNITIINGNTMGTTYSITISHNVNNKEILSNNIDSLLEKINMIFSTYIDSSEISIINQLDETKISE